MSPAAKAKAPKQGRNFANDHAERPYNKIREPQFAERLTQACEGNPHCPPMHNGRLGWIQRELASRYKENISIETVRKWLSGEAKPRPDKLGKLAQLLGVDLAWLSLGVDPSFEPREKKIRNALADGVVNLVAGLIQMDGGFPAFPQDDDKDAEKNHVDLHAIIRGAKYDLHVSMGEIEKKQICFTVPTTYDRVVVLGVVKRGFDIEILELTPDVIAQGKNHGGSIQVRIDAADRKIKRINSFSNRL